MKRVFLLTLMVFIVSGIGLLYAQIQYDFELEVVGQQGWVNLDIHRSNDPVETHFWSSVNPPTILEYSTLVFPGSPITKVVVTAQSSCRSASFYESRTNIGYNNYFFIDLNLPEEDPTPPNNP